MAERRDLQHLVGEHSAERVAHVGPEPTITRQPDGTLAVSWPAGRGRTVECSTELLESAVEQYNDRVRDLAAEHKMRTDAEAEVERLQGELRG